MPDLVSLEDVKEWLEIPEATTTWDQLLDSLASRIEKLLQRVKNRTFAPAAAAVTVTVDGTGERWLYLDRPVGTLTTIKIGIDVSNPSETITPGPTTIIAQGRRLYRQDGGVFPCGVANVHVTYNAASSLDLDAQQAVLEAVALAFRSRGSEDAVSETHGSFSHTLRKSFMELPSWQAIPRRPVLA